MNNSGQRWIIHGPRLQ